MTDTFTNDSSSSTKIIQSFLEKVQMQSHMHADFGTAKEGTYWNISNTKPDLYLIKPSSRNGSCRVQSQKWNMALLQMAKCNFAWPSARRLCFATLLNKHCVLWDTLSLH